jgi:hypothetical protein
MSRIFVTSGSFVELLNLLLVGFLSFFYFFFRRKIISLGRFQGGRCRSSNELKVMLILQQLAGLY